MKGGITKTRKNKRNTCYATCIGFQRLLLLLLLENLSIQTGSSKWRAKELCSIHIIHIVKVQNLRIHHDCNREIISLMLSFVSSFSFSPRTYPSRYLLVNQLHWMTNRTFQEQWVHLKDHGKAQDKDVPKHQQHWYVCEDQR